MHGRSELVSKNGRLKPESNMEAEHRFPTVLYGVINYRAPGFLGLLKKKRRPLQVAIGLPERIDETRVEFDYDIELFLYDHLVLDFSFGRGQFKRSDHSFRLADEDDQIVIAGRLNQDLTEFEGMLTLPADYRIRGGRRISDQPMRLISVWTDEDESDSEDKADLDYALSTYHSKSSEDSKQFLAEAGAQLEKDERGQVIAGLINPFDKPVSEEQVKCFAAFPALQRLTIMGQGLREQWLIDFIDMQHLECLDISLSKLTPSGVACLSTLPALRTLGLTDCNLTREAVGKLDTLNLLRELSISECHFDDRDMKLVGNLKRIESLRLDSLSVSDEGMKSAKGLFRLKKIELCRLPVSSKCVANFVELPDMEEVDIQMCPIGDDCFSDLAKIRNLKSLTIGYCEVFGQDFDLLAATPIQSLNIFSDCDGEALRKIASIGSLKEIYVDVTNFKDGDIMALKQLKKLNNLRITPTNVSDEVLGELRCALPDCVINGKRR